MTKLPEPNIIHAINRGDECPTQLILKLINIIYSTPTTLLDLTDGSYDTIRGIHKGVFQCTVGSLIQIKQYAVKSANGVKVIIISELKIYEQRVEPPIEYQQPKFQVVDDSIDNIDEVDYIPIAHLSSSLKSFIIKGRVVEKHGIKPYTNANGQGKVLRFKVADKESSIDVACFNDIAEKFDSQIEKNSIYTFKNGLIKSANKKFTTANNDYAITLDKTSEVELCEEDKDYGAENYDFIPLNEIEKRETGLFDVIGVVLTVAEKTEIVTKGGDKIEKRLITFTDESNVKAMGTLWKESVNEDIKPNSIIALRKVSLKKFQGKITFSLNPSNIIKDTNMLRYSQLESFVKQREHTDYGIIKCYIRDVIKKYESSEPDGLTKYSVIADILNVSAKMLYYVGCPWCKKKVNERVKIIKCEKCNKVIEQPATNLMLNIRVGDQTGSIFLILFNEQAEKLFKIKGDDLKRMKENKEDDKISKFLNSFTFMQFEFVITAKKGLPEQEKAVYYIMVAHNEINYISENQRILKDMQKLIV